MLQAVVLKVNSRAVQFKLAPTYTLYMAIRRLLLARTQMGMPPAQHSRMVADFVSKTSKLIQQAIQVSVWILCQQDLQTHPANHTGEWLDTLCHV